MIADPPAFADRLGSLFFHLQLARRAYEAYLANGRTFLLASIIFDHNRAARRIAISCSHLFPDELQDELQQLVFHFDVWSAQWVELQRRMNPKAGDEFVFESMVAFPRDAVERLSRFHHQGRDRH